MSPNKHKKHLETAFAVGYHSHGMSVHTDLGSRDTNDTSHPYSGHPMNDHRANWHDKMLTQHTDHLPDGWKANSDLMMAHELGRASLDDEVHRWGEDNADSSGSFESGPGLRNLAMSEGRTEDLGKSLGDKLVDTIQQWRLGGGKPPIDDETFNRQKRILNNIDRVNRIRQMKHPFTGEPLQKPSKIRRFKKFVNDNYPVLGPEQQ